MHRLVLLLWVLSPAPAADLKSKIDEIVSSTPALANAYAGLHVVSLNDGQVLYERNAGHLFVPASNMKLFTTALALMRLGPQYRLTTQISAARLIDSRGTLDADLVFEGGGDP